MASFEQTQSIITRIQQILRDYPYGNAVLLELLQNADDAKAKTATAVFETFVANESHPAARSPALLFHNSSIFTERDLQNIQNIGGLEETSKRHDATKVGRFGIGFNSSFHISDVVAFVTGNELIVFDPAREHLPPLPGGIQTGGMKWNIPTFETDSRFTEEQKLFARQLLDAFEQSDLGFKKGTYYDGTIFRLPLRIKPSKLWKEVHRPVDIAKLLIDFFESATLGMVVLKNLEGIQAKVHRKHPTFPSETLFNVTAAYEKDANLKMKIMQWLKNYTEVVSLVMSETEKLTVTEHYHRDRLAIQRNTVTKLPKPELMVGETIVTLFRGDFLEAFSAVVTKAWETDKEFRSALDDAVIVGDGNGQGDEIVQFQIAHQFGPGNGWTNSKVWEIASESAQNRHPVDVPWGATIVNVFGNVDDGRLMCFFPIKQGTQLPVHVHGYFHVSSDRQSIKDLNDKWNKALVSEVIPHSYFAVVSEVKKHKRGNFYKLLPTLNYTDGTVALIAKETLTLFESRPFVSASDGSWQMVSSVVFPFFADPNAYQPSSKTSAAIHCMLVASAKSNNQLLATFPNFDDTKLPSVEQMDQLQLLASVFKSKIRSLTPNILRSVLQLIPARVASLYLTNSTIAMELFLMCTVGANAKVPNYYDKLPVIPLANCPPYNLAFSGMLPVQLVTKVPFAVSNDRTPCLVCKSKASVAFANEALPHRVVKTLSTQQTDVNDSTGLEDLMRRVDGYILTDTEYQKQLGISVIGVADVAAYLSQISAKGPLKWTNYEILESDGKTKTSLWKLENESINVSLTGSVLSAFLNEALATLEPEDPNKAILARIPFLPALPATTATSSANRISTSLCDSPNQVKCFITIDKEDVALAALLRGANIGIEIDSTIISGNVIANIGLVAKLNGTGTLALLKNHKGAVGPSLAKQLSTHFARNTKNLMADDVNSLNSISIFETVDNRLVSIRSDKGLARLLPKNFSTFLAGAGPLVGPLMALFAGGSSEMPVNILVEGSHAMLHLVEEVMSVERMSVAEFLVCAALISPDLAAATEGSLGKWLWNTLVKELVVCPSTPLLEKLIGHLSEKSVFVDKWGTVTPKMAIVQTKKLTGDTKELLAKLMSTPSPTNLLLPRIVSLPSDLNEDQVTIVANKLGIAPTVRGRYLVAVAEVLSELMLNSKKIEHQYVTLLLEFIANDAKELLPEVVSLLSSIPFIPTVTATELLNIRVSVPNNSRPDAQGELTSPANCSDETVFRAAPSKVKKCLHPYIASTPSQRNALIAAFELFKWNAEPPLSVLLSRSEEACADCETRRSKSLSLLTRPTEYHEFFMEETYSALTPHIASLTSSTVARLQIYFPTIDAVGTKKNMTFSAASQGLQPLFVYIDKSTKTKFTKLFAALEVRDVHPAIEIVAAINSIPLLRHPTTPLKDVTTIVISDDERRLFRQTLGYLVHALPKGPDGKTIIDKAVATSILVPTSDKKTNYADKTFYDFYNSDHQEPSNTVLWNGILPADARLLGLKHTGLNVLSHHNMLNDGSKRGKMTGLMAGGQRLSLLNGIKRILNDYNDPTAILFEMIQNADDAGAKKIEIILDERSFKSDGAPEGYFGNGMRSQLGPALIIKNDAVFTPEDFDAIHDIGVGHKSNDSSKIGRFGVGFNSVYHITDCPSIVSAGKLLIFDPSTENIDIASAGSPGLMLEHINLPNISTQFPEQLKPYEAYGVKFGQHYNGTLFRLPLRQTPNSKSISDQKISIELIMSYIQAFKQMAHDIPLFLKSIEKIQISKVTSLGSSPIFTTAIKNVDEIRKYRSSVAATCSDRTVDKYFGAGPLPTSDGAISIINGAITVDCHLETSASDLPRLFKLFTLVDKAPLPIAKAVPENLRKKLSCSVTVAMQISVSSSFPTKTKGRVHCFLPLPGKDLPFHAHAIFAVSSDRKGMWTTGMTDTVSWDAAWNKHLMTVTLPRCFIGCITTVKQPQLTNAYEYWYCWPQAEDDTKALAEDVFRLAYLHNAPVFPTADGPSTFKDSVFTDTYPAPAQGFQYNAVVEVMTATRNPIVVVCAGYKDVMRKIDPTRELCPVTVARILKSAAGTQIFVPFTAICESGDGLRHIELVARELQRYCSHGKASLNGLPLTVVSTNELAVIHSDNPCFYVGRNETATKLFKDLCPHLTERNLLKYYTAGEENIYRFKFEVPSLVQLFPALSRIRSLDFLSQTQAGNDVHWNGDNESMTGRWLNAFWTLISAVDVPPPGQLTGAVAANEAPSLKDYPLIPIRGPVAPNVIGCKLRAMRDKNKISNGSHGLRVMSDLIAKLQVENVDSGFTMANKVIDTMKIEIVSVTHVIQRSLLNIDVYNDFSDQERDSIRRAMLSETKLPEEFKQLPLFRVIKNGRAINTSITGVTNAIPYGAPITSICEGLAMEALSHGDNIKVVALTTEDFILNNFIPSLGDLPVTDELENWRFVKRSKASIPIKDVPNVKLPTSVSFAKASTDPAKAPLTALIIKYICLNEMKDVFDHPTFTKFGPLARKMALSSVSVTRRAEQYIRPLLDQCYDKPLRGILHQLHRCFASQNLMTIAPLPFPFALDDEVAAAIQIFKKPATDTEAISSLIHCYYVLMMSDEGRAWLCKQLTGGRQDVNDNDALSLTAISMVLEMNKRIANFRGVLGKLPIYSCEPYPDHATPQLLFEMPDKAHRCPSQLNNSPYRPIYSETRANWYPVSACVKYSSRWVCWTQLPTLHPLLEDIEASCQPSAKHVVAHIQELIRIQRRLKPSVLIFSLKKCYELLAAKPTTELAEVSIEAPIFALPPDVDGLVKCVPAQLIVDLSAVRIPESRKVPLNPFYYTLADDFPKNDMLWAVVRRIKPPTLPNPRAVLSVLHFAANQMNNFVGLKRTTLERQYESLLRILLTSCKHYSIPMEWNQTAKETEILCLDKGKEGHYSVNMSMIPVPHWHGQGMIFAKDACAPDDNIVLARINHSARVTELPVDLCTELRIQSISLRITETPFKVEAYQMPTGPLPLGVRKCDVEEVIASIKAINMLLPSSSFQHVMDRVLATNLAKRGLSVPDASIIKQVKIIPVSHLITRIIDNRFPKDQIFSEGISGASQVIIVSNLTTKQIFVNPFAVAAKGAPLEGLICKELGRLLGGKLLEILPIVSVLTMVTKEVRNRVVIDGGHRNCHWNLDFDFTLDLLGCIADDRKHEAVPIMESMKNDAALFRLAEMTGIDFSCSDTQPKREQRYENIESSKVIERFLLLSGEPLDYLDAMAKLSERSTQRISERDVALYHSTAVNDNTSFTDLVKFPVAVGGLTNDSGMTYHSVKKSNSIETKDFCYFTV